MRRTQVAKAPSQPSNGKGADGVRDVENGATLAARVLDFRALAAGAIHWVGVRSARRRIDRVAEKADVSLLAPRGRPRVAHQPVVKARLRIGAWAANIESVLTLFLKNHHRP